MVTEPYVVQLRFVTILVIKQTLLHNHLWFIYTDRTGLHSFCTESPRHACLVNTPLMTSVQASEQNRLGIWQSHLFVSGLQIHQKLVRFLYNPIHLLCIHACFDSIHILLCMQQFHAKTQCKTICEKKYEIAAWIINVWGYTEIWLKINH